jgi:hypothetical protein
MASNEYKLSVVDGTELSLSLNAGIQGADGADGADALWNYKGPYAAEFIRVTGELTDESGELRSFPDMEYYSLFNGRPRYRSTIEGISQCNWSGGSNPKWILSSNTALFFGTWSSTLDVPSPELVTNWQPEGTNTGTPVVTKINQSYNVGDVVTSEGSSWYCTQAYTVEPDQPPPPEATILWSLIAAKGATGSDGANGVNGFGYDSLSSLTSRQMGLNSKQFTVNRNTSETAYRVGTRVRVIPAAAPSQFMEGNITAFFENSLTVFVDHVVGAGTYTNWDFSVAGLKGDVVGAVTLSGDQLNINGNKTFKNQIQLDGQSLTDNNSALTMGLADARYGATYVGIKEDNVPSVSNTPIKLTSVTLPIGTYQIDSNIAATAAASNGGFLFGLKSNNPIKISLFETYGTDGGPTTNNVAASDSTTLTQRLIAAGNTLTNKRQLVGLLEVVTNNTEVSIEFSQTTTTPEVASATRKRAYIIARKIA